MGFFGLFGKKQKETTTHKNISITDKKNEQDRKFEKEMAILKKADEEYKSSHDLEKAIKTYQSILEGCTWNAFNYQKKLASYYLKAGRYDDAWGTLSQAQHDAVKRGQGSAYKGQIRMEQFKVLKAQKKYKQALETLCRAYVVNNAPYGTWNKDSFIKNAKTCAKELDLSERQLDDLARLVGKAISKQDDSETNIRQTVSAFLK